MRKSVSSSELEINDEGIEYQPMEKWTFDLVMNDDPEHWLMAKELFNFTEKFFGAEDFKVLIGETSVEARCSMLGIKVKSFKSRINRKMPEYEKIVARDY